MGRTDRAERYALTAVSLAPPERAGAELESLFPNKGAQAEVWWQFLRNSPEPEAQRLRRVATLLDGKAAPEDLAAWADEVKRQTLELREDYLVQRRLTGLADTLLAYGKRTEAEACLAAAGDAGHSAAPFQRLGDLAAEAGDWKRSAAAYARGVQAAPDSPVLLYLQGRALVRGGSEAAGRALIERAKFLPLADENDRSALARAMEEHGEPDAAREQNELILRTCDPGLGGGGDPLRNRAQREADRGNFTAAADDWERSLLPIYRTNAGFIRTDVYLLVRFVPHAWRARGLLKAGDAPGAVREAEAAADAMPGNIELAIDLVPLLERAGRKDDADAVFRRAMAVQERTAAEFPRCAHAHNNAAWLAAKCGRDLEQALAHARRATQMAPNKPASIDTLAEVLFRLGRRDEAVEQIKKCLEIDPKSAYYRSQMKRFTGAPSTAPRRRRDRAGIDARVVMRWRASKDRSRRMVLPKGAMRREGFRVRKRISFTRSLGRLKAPRERPLSAGSRVIATTTRHAPVVAPGGTGCNSCLWRPVLRSPLPLVPSPGTPGEG